MLRGCPAVKEWKQTSGVAQAKLGWLGGLAGLMVEVWSNLDEGGTEMGGACAKVRTHGCLPPPPNTRTLRGAFLSR